MPETYAFIDAEDILSWDELSTDDEHPVIAPVQSSSQNSPSTSTCHKYLEFTDMNPTTFHVVRHFAKLLDDNGFVFIDEQEPITPELEAQINAGGKFYTLRSDLTILPFVIGGKWTATQGVGLAGCHIDALTAKLKPSSLKPKVDGYELLGVTGYSGGLDHLRLDRDLGLGGAVLIRRKDGTYARKLVTSPWPIARVPSLAEHFGVDAKYNPETEMVPVIGFDTEPEVPIDHPLADRHSAKLLRYVSSISDVPVDDIVELELELYDTQKAVIGGLKGEFVFAPRLDDRLCSWAAIYGLIEYANLYDSDSLAAHDGLSMVLLVDSEEIGSGTRTGVKGKFLNATIDKILVIKKQPPVQSVVFANSILLSADVTHLMNPNFKSAYLDKHYPLPNTGMTIKIDANGHVASEYVGYNLLKTLTSQNQLKLQQFHIRNDASSGGTIGPYLATATGARVIDIGLPILSMHSVRAMCGSEDVQNGVDFFKAFFEGWRQEYNKYRGL
ncbi:vacuolar aminopeptidase 1 [Yamadazyma tenuis]|nr:vacuolar aminopeptidase 1 [Yamadazyma tenuis]